MKPGFALSLSFEGISLLQRAAGGWRLVGEVAVESPDLAGDLRALRDKAGVSVADDLRCKVIIPNEEIRYVSVRTGSFDGAAREAMVRSALEDATPYPVDDLAFDTSTDGDLTHVALVVRDTLVEAEAFAVEHGFNPICFVSAPGDNPFLGEPFFGASAHAAKYGDVRNVKPDGIAVVVIGPVTPPETSEPPAAPPVDAPEAPDASEAPATAGFSSRRAPSPDADGPGSDDLSGEGGVQGDPPASQPVVFKSAKAKADDAAAEAAAGAPAVAPAETAPEQESVATPPVSVTAPTLDVPDPDDAGPPDGPDGADDPEGRASGISGFLSRRKRSRRVEPAPLVSPRAAPPGAALSALPAQSKSVTAPKVTGSGPVLTAVSRPTDSAFLSATHASPQAEEAARMTVFGARAQAEARAAPRHLGLIVSVGLLVFLAGVAAWATVFLEDGVAGLFRAPAPATELAAAPDTPAIGVRAVAPDAAPAGDVPTTTAAATPDRPPVTPDDTPLATGTAAIADTAPATPDPAPQDGTEAAPTTLALLPPSRIDLPALPAPRRLTQPALASPPSLTDTDSAVLEALRPPAQGETRPDQPDASAPTGGISPVTGPALAAGQLLDTAPQEPETPSIIGLDDLFVASIDRTDLSQDAVALPSVAMLNTDLPPGAVSSPVAAGTAFDLDTDGLVVATVEGTLNPDGVMVFLGRPAIVPPAVPVRLQTQPEVEADTPRLAGRRPRLRPTDLAELIERDNLGGLTRAELGGLRPRARPESHQQQADPDQAPTAQAVATSSAPRARPGDFATIVRAAVRAAAPAPAAATATGTAARATASAAASTAAVASVAPATVSPRIPSSASVARQATLKNEINLRRVNLIGVYGSPSNRRALVRLPSGRYKKVKVGDAVDGGRVVAIGDSELRYQKRGRSLTLKIPSS